MKDPDLPPVFDHRANLLPFRPIFPWQQVFIKLLGKDFKMLNQHLSFQLSVDFQKVSKSSNNKI